MEILIQNCISSESPVKHIWSMAEQRVCQLVSTKYRAHDEVFISRLFYGEIKEAFDKVNEDGSFKEVFSKDLAEVFKEQSLKGEVARLSEGIFANIVYHEPQMERQSGADFGFAVIKPDFEKIGYDRLTYKMRRQGLLCQAKRQKPNGEFGNLTSRQIEVIPSHLDYFAVLLYRYKEKERLNLLPFAWWSDDFIDVNEIINFLNDHDDFELFNSSEIVQSLADGFIGTDDQEIIKSVICPEDMPHVIVEITWRDGYPPPPPISPKIGLSGKNRNCFGSAKIGQIRFLFKR